MRGNAELLERSLVPLMGIAPSAFEQRVRSGFVPLFHLPEKKVGDCLGSYRLCNLLSDYLLARRASFLSEFE